MALTISAAPTPYPASEALSSAAWSRRPRVRSSAITPYPAADPQHLHILAASGAHASPCPCHVSRAHHVSRHAPRGPEAARIQLCACPTPLPPRARSRDLPGASAHVVWAHSRHWRLAALEPSHELPLGALERIVTEARGRPGIKGHRTLAGRRGLGAGGTEMGAAPQNPGVLQRDDSQTGEGPGAGE